MTKQNRGNSDQKEIPLTFENDDCFGREEFAINLTKIIDLHAAQEKESYVLSLNASFGAGKTTFIKMWQSMLEEKSVKCVYINAWKHDFNDEPIFPILNAILEQLPDDSRASAKRLALQKAANAVLFVSNTVAQIHTGFDFVGFYQNVKDRFAKSNDTSSNIEQPFNLKQEKMKQFQRCLAEYVDAFPSKRIMIFIDELDRARPDYSVKFLETIKHIFPVRKLRFVICIDREQLEKSVKQLFGEIDFKRYYARFISNDVNLPGLEKVRDLDSFLIRLHDQFVAPLAKQNTAFKFEPTFKDNINEFIATICLGFDLSPREIIALYRKFTHFMAVDLQRFKSEQIDECWEHASVFLIAISLVDRTMYANIGKGQIDSPDMQKLGSILLQEYAIIAYSTEPKNLDSITVLFAFLLNKYNKDQVAKIYNQLHKGMPAGTDETIRDLTGIVSRYSLDVPDESGFQILYKKYEAWQTIIS